jgi:hypothetical protein
MFGQVYDIPNSIGELFADCNGFDTTSDAEVATITRLAAALGGMLDCGSRYTLLQVRDDVPTEVVLISLIEFNRPRLGPSLVGACWGSCLLHLQRRHTRH